MTQTQRVAVIFTIIATVVASLAAWWIGIPLSADVDLGEITLTGTVRSSMTANQSDAISQYEFQTSTRIYQVRTNDERVLNRTREYALGYQLAVVKGREFRRGRTYLIQINDLSPPPIDEPLTITGTIQKTNLYPDHPYLLTANKKQYRAKVVAPTNINLEEAANSNETISVTGISFYYQFLAETYYEFDIYNAVAGDTAAADTATEE